MNIEALCGRACSPGVNWISPALDCQQPGNLVRVILMPASQFNGRIWDLGVHPLVHDPNAPDQQWDSVP